ncbi:MAG: APC family permease [Actinobacteria bacterium]|nr:APC family permease [Actinomycetota bacterium]
MSVVDSTSSEAPQQLAKDSIGLVRVIAFTAAFMGPAASIALGLVAAISFAGFATPFVVLLSFLGALLASNSVAQLARKLPSAGSFYTYNSAILGSKVGFVSGWMMVFAYILWVPSGIGAVGTFSSEFFSSAFGWSINENILLLIVLAIVAGLAFRGIATSTAVDVIVLVIEIGVIVALAATILFKGGPGPSGIHLFDPSNTLHGQFSDITLGMVYTVVIFSGFESGAVLGEETKDPRRNVPRGIFGAVILVGAFYLFVSYAELHGVAPSQIEAFTTNPSQLGFLTEAFWSPSILWLVDLVVALSTLGFVIAAFNAAVRLAFAMGRERMLPSKLASLSRYGTPGYAVAAITVIALAIGLPVTIAEGGFLAFAYIGAVSGISLIILFISVSVTMIVAFLTKYRGEFNPIKHLLFPLLAIVIFGIPLVGTFYPRPVPPYSWLPFVALGWLIIGVIVTAWLARNRSEVLARIGKVFLVEGPEQPYPSAIPPETVIAPEDR